MPLTHLGDMTVEIFLRDYWQQKPVILRQVFPNFISPIDGDELAGLTLEEDVESRLILEKGPTPWTLHHGPLDESIFARLPETHWTLLVQAVDQWVPEVHELLHHFRFIPNWRLDDIMISYAPDQGSVGPHFDYYDVFLLQGSGRRRWRIGQSCDARSPCLANTSLKILKEFEQRDEWVLEPGDILYIPPGIAHWGIAEGESITYSVGFRAPSHSDILIELAQEAVSALTEDQRYQDPGLSLQQNPGEIPQSAVNQIRKTLLEHLTDEQIGQWFGKYMTERKYIEDEPPGEELAEATWRAALEQGALLWRHPAARFAYVTRGTSAILFADGEAYECSLSLAELICAEPELNWQQLNSYMEIPQNKLTLNALINRESLLLDSEQ